MKEVRRDDWVFTIDENKTQNFYAKESAMVLPNGKDFLPELTAFLNELGVDIRKPISYAEQLDDLCYVVFGSAAATDGYELDFYEPEHFASVVVYVWPDMNDRLIRAIKEDEDTDTLLLEVFIT